MFRRLCKTALVFGAFSGFFLLLLYTFQNKFLYQPGLPYRYMEDNPPIYRSPLMRDMLYRDVNITTADNVTIKG